MVEKIVKHRIFKKQIDSVNYEHIEINVKWEGFSVSNNTWEPLTSIYRDIAGLVKSYFR